jgi:hypothetical protein
MGSHLEYIILQLDMAKLVVYMANWQILCSQTCRKDNLGEPHICWEKNQGFFTIDPLNHSINWMIVT